MTEELVPRVATPVHPEDLYAALKVAWPDASRESLLTLMSQVMFETG